MQHTLDRVKAAAVDGRAHNVFYRQQEIESLCRTLLENAEKIRQAIISDYNYDPREVAVEFDLALTAVRTNYALLQPKKSHKDEYAVANGKDAARNRVPVGIVCIEPTAHTIFFSTIAPLSAALAAGNCVIVVVSSNYITSTEGAKLTQTTSVGE
jgi:acyl-CoA reductase-like NAD-dependent aldehyde dehydrogenase